MKISVGIICKFLTFPFVSKCSADESERNDTSTSVFTEFFELRSFIVQFDGEDYAQPHVRIIHTHTLTKKNKHLTTCKFPAKKKKKSLGTKKFRVKCK